MVTIAVRASSRKGRQVGFVQSVLTSSNPNASSLSRAQSVLDGIYYHGYFRVKAAYGTVSNWGHGVLVSRLAWEETGGFPNAISEDLSWANELLLTGHFDNFYSLAETGEEKPPTWNAFKVQRNRWAKGNNHRGIRATWKTLEIAILALVRENGLNLRHDELPV